MKKIINVIKQKWLKDTFMTTILILIMIAIFIILNLYVNSLNINPIDFTKEKLYTLSDESINLIKDIDKDVHIYFFGYQEDNNTVLLAKQYGVANSKITAEAINIDERPDLAKKYGVEDNTSFGIIVEGQDRYKVLTRK
ncbi:MAG: Gldg family protein [Clostridia bacterium]|nr:Gldg family protein [Clostridia bacterium]